MDIIFSPRVNRLRHESLVPGDLSGRPPQLQTLPKGNIALRSQLRLSLPKLQTDLEPSIALVA